jgi:heptosyltransferase-2
LDAGTDNPLRDFCARVDLCQAVVTGDTMALHVGVALGKKVVALFGPTSAAEIELYGDGAKVFTDQLDCLCCYSACNKVPNCQDLISVEMVVQALEPLL